MLLDSYKGRILVAQPKCQSNFFKESLVLVVRHGTQGSWGVMFNQQIPDRECCLADILEHVGIQNQKGIDAPLYIGGPIERNRVCIIHSADWISSTSHEITPDIYITTDLGILAALAGGVGPTHFRACCGISSWAPGQLEGEMKGEEPWTLSHRWLDIPATISNIFETEPTDQWRYAVATAVNQEVKQWF